MTYWGRYDVNLVTLPVFGLAITIEGVRTENSSSSSTEIASRLLRPMPFSLLITILESSSCGTITNVVVLVLVYGLFGLFIKLSSRSLSYFLSSVADAKCGFRRPRDALGDINDY